MAWLAVVALLALPACGGGAAAGTTGRIALLLPETKTARYESADRPDFLARLRQLGYDPGSVFYTNANQDPSLQQDQADAAIANGATVMVLDPVDARSAAAIATRARSWGIPVVSYDRLITESPGVSYYISFDNLRVGRMQAQALVDRLTAMGRSRPTIVMIDGSPTDSNAHQFKQGAHSVLDPLVRSGRLTIAKEYDTPDWSPDQAQNEMEQALTALGNRVDGVYCANDGTASGAIAAMKAAAITPLPPVTGQDAELAAIQRIVAGEQFMTVYKAIRPEAADAAELALSLVTDRRPDPSMVRVAVDNGAVRVPSILLNPVAVTRETVRETVVRDGFVTVAQICTARYAAACQEIGLR
jgi:D-xylose transport system substrate-binding protein